MQRTGLANALVALLGTTLATLILLAAFHRDQTPERPARLMALPA
jgi:hypothetical protein